MCSAASGLARLRNAWAERPGLEWTTTLMDEALAGVAEAGPGGHGAAAGGGEEEEAEEEKQTAEAKEEPRARRAARAQAEAAAATAARERRQADEEGGEVGAQSVRLTLLKGWEVAARWRAAVAACDPERHEQLTTTRVHVPGEPEPRVIKQTIPDTFE